MRSEALLATALAAAVPLEIGLARQLDEGQRDLLRERLAPMLQQGGDDLLYGGERCATTFATYTRTLAVLAFQPGGVTALGLSFCATHPRTHWTAPGPCPDCVAEESGRPAEAAPAAEPARPRVTTIQPAGGVL